MTELTIKPASEANWECVSFVEVMLRFARSFGGVRNAHSFKVCEGGGECNVARAMKKRWGKWAPVVIALPKNVLDWLVKAFAMQGCVDMSYVIWRNFHRHGKNTRVGLAAGIILPLDRSQHTG